RAGTQKRPPIDLTEGRPPKSPCFALCLVPVTHFSHPARRSSLLTTTRRARPPESSIELKKRGPLTSALDPVVQMGHTVPLEDPGALELDVLGSEVVEETAPLAEEHRDEMDLELVEDAGRECELRGSGAVDQHVLVARS